ncbi:hypothetical protein [Burkholderia gladioli]|uniref:hypothetical protein n=1 Tax=Burkholderia gladioli TaxID=28095 RepID=UPI001641F31B|nr:hypothetical protein [Burkholderia gladioli]
MDKYEQRRLALVRLATSLGRGGAAQIARAIGKEPNYISRLLYPPGKDGRKRIGEDTVELLEAKFPDWMSEETKDGGPHPRIAAPRGWDQLRDDQRRAIEELIATMLTGKVAMANTKPPKNGFIAD